jgi:putative DNA primase/helicase
MISEQEFLDRFEGVKPAGRDQWMACCPAHDDRTPSLHVTLAADRWLLYCHAGCTEDGPGPVVSALGLTEADLFESNGNGRGGGLGEIVATYPYVDEAGRLLFEVIRFAPKTFRQRRPDGVGGYEWNLNGTRRVLYRLPQVLAAVKSGETIYVVEGEKDVAAIEKAGGVATCNPGGAGKWREDFTDALRGANVIVVADRDDTGRVHAEKVAKSLEAVAADVRVMEPAEGKDAADHLAAGRGLGEFADLALEIQSVLRAFEEIVARPVRWAWQHRIALSKITALAGRPKIGKGLLYSHLISQVTRGELDGDLSGPRDVILVTTEDDPGDTLKPRLMAAGADLARASIFQMGSRDEPIPFRVPQDAAELGRRVAERNAALVVIDPLLEFIDGKIDSHKSQPVRQAIAALNQIAREHACAVLVIFHLNKGVSSDPLLRHEASVAFTQVVRGGLMLGHDPDDPDGEDGSQRVLAVSSSNLAAIAPSLVFRIDTAHVTGDTDEEIATAAISPIGESSVGAHDLLRGHPDEEELTAANEAEHFLREELADGPRLARELESEAHKIGIARTTLFRARRALGVESAKSGFKGGWEWSLPKIPKPRFQSHHREGWNLGHLRDQERDCGPSEGSEGAQDSTLEKKESSGQMELPRRGCAAHQDDPRPGCRYCAALESERTEARGDGG